MIQANIIHKFYPSQRKPALYNINFNLKEEHCTGIIGESGSGKSTLGKILCGYDSNFKGSVEFNQKDLYHLKLKIRSKIVQMIFQNPYKAFDPRWKIASSLLEVIKPYSMNNKDTWNQINDYRKLFQLDENTLFKYPSELSGGQLQKYAILRAILPSPQFIIADECLSNLDISIQIEIIELFHNLIKQLKIGLGLISHDLRFIKKYCQTIIVLYQGNMIETTNSDLISQSSNPQTRKLFHSVLNI